MQSGFDVCRRRVGQTFRKKLGLYNYKLGHQSYHKEPGMVTVNTAETLKDKGTYEGIMRLRKLKAESHRLMGKFIGMKFVVDKSRIPIIDIPDLTGFEVIIGLKQLKPYVSYHTPQIDEDTKLRMARLNDYNLQENLVPRSGTKLLEKK